jgi:hypothetical protein
MFENLKLVSTANIRKCHGNRQALIAFTQQCSKTSHSLAMSYVLTTKQKTSSELASDFSNNRLSSSLSLSSLPPFLLSLFLYFS